MFLAWFFGAQGPFEVGSDRDHCTGNYIEELNRWYNKSMNCARFLWVLACQMNAIHCRRLSQRCIRMYRIERWMLSTVIDHVNYLWTIGSVLWLINYAGVQQWYSHMTNHMPAICQDSELSSQQTQEMAWRFFNPDFSTYARFSRAYVEKVGCGLGTRLCQTLFPVRGWGLGTRLT